MTLDEAIKHTEEVANGKCDKCAEEHRQLAEWLKDYKRLLTSNHNGKCDRCGGEIYPNTLCIECNDYLARSVFAEEIKQEIEQAMGDFYYSEHDLGVREGFRFALEIIDNHIGKEKE